MQALATIVGYAHRLNPPIVHRDLKPANILLQTTMEGGRRSARLRVGDFGIGGVAAGEALRRTQAGSTGADFLPTALRGACTPLYASPQQKRGELPLDPRDDVYSLGVIWFQMLTGDLTEGPGGRLARGAGGTQDPG
jgi:serine/threonine protein kinase